MSGLSDTDLELVRWVAEARIGDPLPDEFRSYGAGPMIQRLVDAGVVHSVYAAQPIDEAAVAAQRDCREWLRSHK